MFLPTTRKELEDRGVERLDVILVTGDTYIDSPFMGVSLIGRVLESKGFTVGIIAQPDTDSDRDISRLGEPRLFWGITGGAETDTLRVERMNATVLRETLRRALIAMDQPLN